MDWLPFFFVAAYLALIAANLWLFVRARRLRFDVTRGDLLFDLCLALAGPCALPAALFATVDSSKFWGKKAFGRKR